MLVLAIDTATPDLVVGLVHRDSAPADSSNSNSVPADSASGDAAPGDSSRRDSVPVDSSPRKATPGNTSHTDSVLAEQIHPKTRQHAELLIPSVQELLADQNLSMSDLDAIVVGCGPGPFTGLRVGMATAQALGQALDIPVHGVISLDAIAHRLDGTGLVATDARRREVYWALYRDGARLEGPAVCRPADLHPTHSMEGIATLSVPEHLAPQLAHLNLEAQDLIPDSASLVAVADLEADPAPLVAQYLRRPDAVPPKPVQVPTWS